MCCMFLLSASIYVCCFWLMFRHSATKGIVIAMICTFFDAFNVPVFWPILVMYFIMLFCITMKRQIKVRKFEIFLVHDAELPKNSTKSKVL